MQVGDYVRTNNGGIGKIIKCPFKTIYLDEIWGDINGHQTIITDNVYKTSPNIIDLIEVGDYVNGAFVIRFKTDENGTQWLYTNNENAYGYKSDEIKSIVTKEQFKIMEYKLGADKECKKQ